MDFGIRPKGNNAPANKTVTVTQENDRIILHTLCFQLFVALDFSLSAVKAVFELSLDRLATPQQ
ncbi:hypothetical protein KAZ66_00665 [Candidatus Woesebacteria bacterium]|nr:hypothetical protein [Candidatus Woesebacteria bacterium]